MKPHVKAIKELLRVMLLSIIPVLIYQIEAGQFDPKAVYVVGAIALLRGLDKYLHELGVDRDNDQLKHGLTGF